MLFVDVKILLGEKSFVGRANLHFRSVREHPARRMPASRFRLTINILGVFLRSCKKRTKMSKRLFYPFLAVLLVACHTKKIVPASSLFPDIEYEDLDTLVVTAPVHEAIPEDKPFLSPVFSNPSATRSVDLLHTRLELAFDWEREAVLGKASLSLTPYFYPIDQVTLDAKGFEVHSVSMGNETVPYEYDDFQLNIHLGRAYTRKDTLQLQIDYTAFPSQTGGSSAILSDKGLFFINPRQEEGNKPQQIWTQGETENNSRWFPTVDKPNERCTQEILLTVEDRFTTLSNGLLIASTQHKNGMRTDHWKMDLPHAPYLFMIAVGEYAVVKDQWNGLDVNYYVEPEYENDARAIFPRTPEMLSFFSEKLDYPYPWPKFSQAIVRDYVSGAMENTTAVIYSEVFQASTRELVDNLYNEKVVAHELIHHWFGDLVTCESWANLTLNEGFANYGEYLWLEHQFGKDEADYHLVDQRSEYVLSTGFNLHPLIHYGYEDKEDMFDQHSYNKGGLVLHMLRHLVGDEAFWNSLHLYLTRNAFTAVEADELRLAFEDVTGMDLQWFFDQWFFDEGHPKLDIQYRYDAPSRTASVTVEQTQDPSAMRAVFRIPAAIDFYLPGGEIHREQVEMINRRQVFSFELPEKPELIQFEADRVLLCERSESRTVDEYVYQFEHSSQFQDKYDALQAIEYETGAGVKRVFRKAMLDPFWMLRAKGIENSDSSEEVLQTVRRLALEDPNANVRIAAFEKIGQNGDVSDIPLARTAMEEDPSDAVVYTALEAIFAIDLETAVSVAKTMQETNSDLIRSLIEEIFVASGDPSFLEYFNGRWSEVDGFAVIELIRNYLELSVHAEPAFVLESAMFLKGIATDMNQTTIRRLGATKTVNDLHAILSYRAEDATSSATRSDLQAKIRELEKIIATIKESETDPELLNIYQEFPGQ